MTKPPLLRISNTSVVYTQQASTEREMQYSIYVEKLIN